MPIIRDIKDYTAPYEVMLNVYPDQFVEEGFPVNTQGAVVDAEGNALPMPKQHVSKDTKKSVGWIKVNMDYMYTVALSQYNQQRVGITRNYELIKGKLRAADFYAESPVMSFVDELIKDVDLPAYVQHYPILNPPINSMVGEKSKRPDVSRPKAMDADSQSEEGQYYSNLLWQYIQQGVMQKITKQLQDQGVDTSNAEEFQQQVEQLTAEKMKNQMQSYTSNAEWWACNMLNALKVEFNTKELFENGFRDLLICNREFFHIYENRSKTGFTVDKANPKNVWWLTTPDKKYIRDAYAAGIVEIMELSEIIDKYELTEDEVDHLRKYAMMAFFPYARESNLYNSRTQGIDSIQYNTYDQLVLQERNRLESAIGNENNQDINGFLGNAAPNVGTFGNRFVVTTAYWKSKRKVGLLTYTDKDGQEQTTLVDDNYKKGLHPREIDLKWKWENQWYKGLKIGDDIYYVEPLEILDYCPMIGVIHEIENTVSVSLVDLMKPFQTLYNICANQLYRLLEKEKGKGFLASRRHVPLQKGADLADSQEIWLRQMEEEGIIWVDDSPENLKKPSSFNQWTVVDMTLSDQMRIRRELMEWIKTECWELVGLTKQRLGSVAASETATGTNTAVSQSYAQTEPYFVQQEYLENQVLQAIIDVAQYLECRKPESTLSYIDSDGGNAFCKIQTASDLKNRDIKLFMTSRAEDQRIFNKLQDLSQAALQNGVSLYEVAQLYTETSTRKLLDVYKKLKEKQEQFQQQQQETEQKAQQMQEQAQQAQMQQLEKQHQDDIQLKVYEIDTKANTELTIAQIKERMQIHKDSMSTDEPDLLDILAHQQKQQESLYKRDIEQMNLEIKKKQLDQAQQNMQEEGNRKDRKLDLEAERNAIEKKKIATQPTKAKKK